jgi:hypothetical protein
MKILDFKIVKMILKIQMEKMDLKLLVLGHIIMLYEKTSTYYLDKLKSPWFIVIH